MRKAFSICIFEARYGEWKAHWIGSVIGDQSHQSYWFTATPGVKSQNSFKWWCWFNRRDVRSLQCKWLLERTRAKYHPLWLWWVRDWTECTCAGYLCLHRFTSSSRTTGTTLIQIDDKRLTIVIATTGGKLMKNMKNWANYTGFDGSHNRFLYMSMPKLVCARPQQ